MPKQTDINSPQYFLIALKKLVLDKNYQRVINISSLQAPPYWAVSQRKLINYISTRTGKPWEELNQQTIIHQINEIKRGTEYQHRFIFFQSHSNSMGDCIFLRYDHSPHIQNEKDLFKEIQNSKHGFYLEEDLMRHSFREMRYCVSHLLQKRLVMPLRTKKAKKPFRDQKYQFFYLFPVDQDLRNRASFQQFFTIPVDEQRNDLMEHERKFQIWFETKTCVFKKKYEEFCSSHLNKTDKVQVDKEKQKRDQSLIESIDEINRNAIPNLQLYIDIYHEQNKPPQ